MREQQIGHVVISSTVDRPWSQYFCCMLAGNREFVRKYPVATKRALRAILKTADVSASESRADRAESALTSASAKSLGAGGGHKILIGLSLLAIVGSALMVVYLLAGLAGFVP